MDWDCLLLKIVEAHDANAWAENNNNNTDREKTAPFTLLYQLSIDNKM